MDLEHFGGQLNVLEVLVSDLRGGKVDSVPPNNLICTGKPESNQSVLIKVRFSYSARVRGNEGLIKVGQN